MLRITAFNGSARKDGNTAILLNAVLAELREQGFETELVRLAGRLLSKLHGLPEKKAA